MALIIPISLDCSYKFALIEELSEKKHKNMVIAMIMLKITFNRVCICKNVPWFSFELYTVIDWSYAGVRDYLKSLRKSSVCYLLLGSFIIIITLSKGRSPTLLSPE
jgi:hypothetical protein